MIADILKLVFASALVAGLMSACVSQHRPSIGDKQHELAHSSEKFYLEALERSRPVFRVDPVRSLAVMEVHRSGSLARLGHDHVIASHDIQGYVAPNDGRADLQVPLHRLTVDEPELRAEAGFDTQPSAAFIEGTRQNMLQKVLEIDRHPFAFVSVRASDANHIGNELNIAMTLHGVTR